MRIRLSQHAREQCEERGASEEEVFRAVREGLREPARSGRILCRLNTDFAAQWQDKYYAVKQVAPIIVEEGGETVVVTVYTFYF
jgi:hypothetical protein